MAKTALIVPIPEAERVVGNLRRRFDSTALEGVPAHVTVLVPFIDGGDLQPIHLQRLETLFAKVPSFHYVFGSVGRFVEATYLAPSSPSPFIRLTETVTAAFPEYLPYGGVHSDIVPHLTVAHGSGSGPEVAAAELAAWVGQGHSVRGQCSRVQLIQQNSDGWQLRSTFNLAQNEA